MASPTIQTFARQAPRIFKPLETAMNRSPETSKEMLRQMRKDVTFLRMEYWYRKALMVRPMMRESHAEAQSLYRLLNNPGEMTYRQVAKGLIGAIQLYGCFCLGEMGGRLHIVGYGEGFSPRNGLEGPAL
eukprot:gb/GEZN01024114.1/.p1 GENE.gb/GEZN01024114.1/~~gb/GEZN01024114.1/.p1  ORF type:complete len:137 (-),score=20.19 gb/GEZN01024114.1/:164-553(-)